MATRSEAELAEVPHFEVTTLDGRRVRYGEFWQRRNLVLVSVGPHEREAGVRHASRLLERRDDFEREEAVVVVTADTIPGLPASTVLVADRWGEILHRGSAAEPLDVDDLLSWVHFAAIQCPECPP
jgi:hypothetical protein